MFVVQNVPKHYMWDFYEPVLTPTKFTAAEKKLQCVAGWHRKFLGIVLPSETLLAYNQDTGPLSKHECLSSSFSPYNFSIEFKVKHELSARIFLHYNHLITLRSAQKSSHTLCPRDPSEASQHRKALNHVLMKFKLHLSLTCNKIWLSLLGLLWRMFLR